MHCVNVPIDNISVISTYDLLNSLILLYYKQGGTQNLVELYLVVKMGTILSCGPNQAIVISGGCCTAQTSHTVVGARTSLMLKMFTGVDPVKVMSEEYFLNVLG